MINTLNEGYKEIEYGTNEIETTSEKFHEINQAITNMVNNVQSITTSLSNIAANSEEMNSTIEDIAGISEDSLPVWNKHCIYRTNECFDRRSSRKYQ